jgi:RNA polymerase sigma factor (sigma-70 family)
MLNAHRHISKEEAVFKEFFHQYKHQLISHISKKIQEREDAKDVLQNTLVHLWDFKHLMNHESWQQIVINTCNQKIAEFYRKEKKALLRDHLDENIQISEPDEVFEKERLLNSLESSINLIIPPIRQSIFRMNKLQGLRQQEIAIQLKISKRTVENHIAKAMNFLKNLHQKS